MEFFRTLFSLRDNYLNYALFDQNGACVAFIKCRSHPGGKWVEVKDIDVGRLKKQMPPALK